MATKFEIILAADTKNAENGINQVVGGVETLRKKYITGKGALEDYNRALNDQLAHNNEMLTPLKALETNYKLVHQELSRMTIAFGENNDIVKELGNAYERAGQQLADYKAKLASNNADASLKDESAKIQAQLEAEQKAIDDSRTYYKALGDSMGYAENEANILNNALKKTISAGGSETAINDAASAYLKQKDAIAEVARQEELYVAQVQNAINQEKAREQAIEDANNASLESWKRYTDFVAQQQAKISGYSLADSSRVSYNTSASPSTANFSSSEASMAYYKQIGDEVGYAREEVTMYANELKRLMSLNAQNIDSEVNLADAIEDTTTAYKASKERLDSLTASTGNYFTKLVSLTKNIITFQLLMQPIRKAFSLLKETITESITVAAEAEQTFSKLSTVFAGLEETASNTATSLASSLGVADSTAASALSTVGDLLQAQGMGTAESLKTASEWVEKFQDIIAFKDINMDLEEFATNFMSGATGNLRNFRTFGSIVKESAVNAELAEKGLDGLSDSQLNLEKMVIRAEMALEQQANAIGATNREWETTLSITRRYDEQNKALMENIGDAINTKLNPLKSWWADIAEQINKAHDAQVQFNAGQKNISVYDINANEDDYKSFKNKLKTEVINPRNAAGASQIRTSGAEEALRIMTEYNASLDDVLEIWTNIPDSTKDELTARAQLLEQQKQQEALLKTLKENWASLTESAVDFAQQLDSITGANTGLAGIGINSYLNTAAPTSQGGLDTLSQGVATKVQGAIENAISSFDAADWKTFVSSLDLAFGTATENEGLEEKINQLRTLYSTVYSYISKDGEITEEEQGYLDNILSIYDAILARQKAITDEAEKQVELDSQKKTLLSSATGYESQTAQIGMTDRQKALFELEEQLKEAKSIVGLTVPEIEELNELFEQGKTALGEYFDKLEKYEASQERQTTLDDYYEGTADYQKQLRQLRMTDFQKTVDDLVSQLTGDEELDEAIQNQISAYTELYVAQEKYTKELENAEAWKNLGQNALNSLGTVGSAANTLLYGEGDIWTRILSVCLDIFQQSESWTELVEMFDAILEPLMPIVDSVVSLLGSLDYFFDSVTFSLKVIASLITSAITAIEFVADIIEWAWDNVQIAFRNLGTDLYNWTHWGEDKQRENYKDLASYFNETVEKQNDRLDRIWYDMPKESGDLSTLEDLLSRDIINLDQYNAGLRVANKDMVFDPVSPVGYVASSGNSGSTTIKYGDVQVVINGGNTEQIQSTLIQILRKAGYDMPNVPITA